MKNLFALFVIFVALGGSLFAFKQNKESFKPNWSNRFIAPSTNSQVRLTVRHQNGTQVAAGQFGSFSSNIFYFGGEDLALKFDLVSNSYTAGNNVVDSIMNTQDWLSTDKHPSISFASTGTKRDGKKLILTGDLSLKGITKSMEMSVDPIEMKKSINNIDYFVLAGKLKINRTDFGISGQRNWYPSPWKVDMTMDSGSTLELNIHFIAQSWSKKWGETIFSANDNPVGKIYKEIQDKGVKRGLKLYESIKKESPDQVDQNTLGYTSFVLTLGDPSPLDYEQALELFEYNIKQFPDYTTAKNNYAETLAMAGRIEKAREWYMKVKADDESYLDQEFFDYYEIK